MDVASIVDGLEKNSSYYPRNIFLNCNRTADVYDMVDFVSSWMVTDCRREIYKYDFKTMMETQHRLVQLRNTINKQINEIKKKVKEQKQTKLKMYEFVCGVCNKDIFKNTIDSDTNFWKCLQQHEHIEEQYVELLKSKPYLQHSSSPQIANNEIVLNGTTKKDIPVSNVPNNNVKKSATKQNRVIKQNITKVTTNHPAPDNSFRFNFQIGYDHCIEKILYPLELCKRIRALDKVPDYTIQCSSITSVSCLLCNCELPYCADTKIPANATKNILIHASGQKHMKFTQSPEVLLSLKQYHRNWMQLEVPFQAHQIYFRPEGEHKTYCYLCKSLVFYKELTTHILSQRHKTPLFLVWDIAEGKEPLNFISCKQAEVYGRIIKTYEKGGNKFEDESDSNTNTSVSTNNRTSIEENASNTDSASPAKTAANNNKLEHDIVPSVTNSTSENVLDLLENRYRNHLKYLSIDNDLVTCNGCKIQFTAELNFLRMHVVLKAHSDACGVSKIKCTYHCEICNVFYRIENKWQEHLKCAGHAAKCECLGKSRREKLNEYECKTCNCIIFGDKLSLTRHRMSYRKKASKKEVKLPEGAKALLKSEEHMVRVLTELVAEANYVLTASTHDVAMCCRALELALSEIYENCKVYPFGSRVSGLGNKGSDLDVFVDVGDMYSGNKYQDAASQEELVKKCSRILRRAKNNMFSAVNPIPTARTPIIQVYHKPTDLDCDLSFRHGLSVENTKFLKLCIQLQPATRSLILLLKKWSAHCKLNEHITTYALSMMVIFYLQVNGHLLSVAQLRQLNPLPSVIIAGWETIHYMLPIDALKMCIKPYNHTPKMGLIEFFTFYLNFKFNTDVICPLLGRCLPKSAFAKVTGEDLPAEMQTYVKKLQTDMEPEHFRIASPLCIQDPFDLSHNLTKACQPGTLDKFKKLCELTIKHLSSIS